MSATACPNPDKYDAVNQMHHNRLNAAAFPNNGLDAWEGTGNRIILEERKRPLICALADEIQRVGWLGKTQWEISAQIGKIADRAWFSRALHQGRMSADLFIELWFHEDRPKDTAVTAEQFLPERNRSASIGIARAIAKRAAPRTGLVPEFLTELYYEMGCVVVDSTSEWEHARRTGSGDGAIRIVERCREKNVIPFWYTDIQRRHTESEIKRLTQNSQIAFDQLEFLSQRWRGVLVATADMMESMRGKEERDAA